MKLLTAIGVCLLFFVAAFWLAVFLSSIGAPILAWVVIVMAGATLLAVGIDALSGTLGRWLR